MKIRFILFLLLIPFFCFAKNPADLLRHYLKNKDYFRLRTEFYKNEKALNKKDRLYFRAFVDNAFNRCKASSISIDQLLHLEKNQLSDSLRIKLLQLQIDDEVKTYHYKKAAETADLLISQYGKFLDTAELADIKNSNILWKALAKVDSQEIVRHQTSTVIWKRDTVGLMNIPIRIGNTINDFVFDTGANLSMISTSYAKLLHLQLIETAFDLGSSTSITNKATLAIAPSLFIGNIEMKNVVFMVLPDDKLSFPQIHYKINAIIGYPVISEIGEVTIKQSGILILPETSHHSDLHNLAMDDLLPVLAVKTGNDTLSYSFDTGAKVSMFYKPYFDKYKETIIQQGKPDSVSLGGAGGAVKYKAYRLATMNFSPAGKPVQLTNIDVLTSPLSDNGGNYDGTIGQDLIAKFSEMTINFKDMYIDFN